MRISDQDESVFPVDPTFPTLRSVGYRECRHPRVIRAQCADCGAIQTLAGGWMSGSLDFQRLVHESLPPEALT